MHTEIELLSQDLYISERPTERARDEDFVLAETPTTAVTKRAEMEIADPQDTIAALLQGFPQEDVKDTRATWSNSKTGYPLYGHERISIKERTERVRAQLRQEQNKR